jgi:hypothetical protein
MSKRLPALVLVSTMAFGAACSSPRPVPTVAIVTAGGESSSSPSPAPTVTASSSPPPSHAPTRSLEEQAVDAALTRATEALTSHAPDQVTSALDEARRAAAGNDSLLDRVALRAAAFRVEQGDIPGAVTLVQERIDAAAAAHSLREFGLHDAMLFLREAQGDPMDAYLEAEAMRTVADGPTVSPDVRARLRLGYTWQRAHTLVHLTEAPTARDRARVIGYAREAREAFARLAREQDRSLASIDVLEEDAATVEHDATRAVTAAERLDVSSLDPQDRYITLRAFIGARNDAGVSRLRAAIDEDHDVDLLTSVYRRLAREALDRYDAEGASPAPSTPPSSRRRGRAR